MNRFNWKDQTTDKAVEAITRITRNTRDFTMSLILLSCWLFWEFNWGGERLQRIRREGRLFVYYENRIITSLVASFAILTASLDFAYLDCPDCPP